MVILKYIDIDKFLTKNDFQKYIDQKLTWPWPETHFIRSQKCFGCGQFFNALPNGPHHFVIKMSIEHAKALIRSSLFWCSSCTVFTIYDHYIEEECEHCHKNNATYNIIQERN